MKYKKLSIKIHRILKNIKQKSLSFGIFVFSIFFPVFVWGAGTQNDNELFGGGGGGGSSPTDLKGFVLVILGLIRLAIPVIVGLTLLVFLWGLAKYILAVGGGPTLDSDGKKSKDPVSDAKRLMIWGIIALFVMVSVWGILSILVGSFGYGFAFPQLRIQHGTN